MYFSVQTGLFFFFFEEFFVFTPSQSFNYFEEHKVNPVSPASMVADVVIIVYFFLIDNA